MQNITPQQQAIMLQLQQAQQQSQHQSQSQSRSIPPPATTTSKNGVTTTLKHLSDGDEQYRNAKRRKPTSLSLPLKYTTTSSIPQGPTDSKLSSSLVSLEQLSTSYQTLQKLESKLDWTFSRKAIELSEKRSSSSSNGEEEEGGGGERVSRIMRIHIECKVKDQEWQLLDQLENAGKVPQTENEQVKVPRIEIKLSGKIQDDESQAKTPFTKHYQRITIESPLLSKVITWDRSTSSTSFPSSLNFSIPQSIPSSVSPSSSIQLKITLFPFAYSNSQSSQLFTLFPPELSNLLQISECTRQEVLHNLWLYVRKHNLMIENLDPTRGIGGGIKTQDSSEGGLSKKYFGGTDKIAWHHLGEWVNRWLAPTVPRICQINGLNFSKENTSSHEAFDLPVSIFPFSTNSSQTRSLLSSKTSSILSTLTNTNISDSSSQQSHPLVQSLESINSQISISILQVSKHQQQLNSLLSFTRDPKKFLENYLESQNSNLETVLNGRGGRASIGGFNGGMMGLGDGWKESLRGSKYFNTTTSEEEGEGEGEWVKEAVGVWLAREREGELRKQLAAMNNNNGNGNGQRVAPGQQQQGLGGGYGGRR
ncbi:hypothetical protein JCM3765_000124 [Sporobolomyces pararoseus]